jgi:hypothetical protein
MIHTGSSVVGSYWYVGNFAFLNFGSLHLGLFIFYPCHINAFKDQEIMTKNLLVYVIISIDSFFELGSMISVSVLSCVLVYELWMECYARP